MSSARVATIDIGTNTILLLVAERDARGELVGVVERATITRLGQGVDKTRVLAPEAVARAMHCLEAYAAEVRAAGVSRVDVVGTSAMRDASGGEQLVERVRELFGVPARVLTGDEEARVTFLGALSGLSLPQGDEVAVFDIGGGSTEIVIAKPELGEKARFAKSYDVGSVRMTERVAPADPPTADDLRRLRETTRAALEGVPKLPEGAVPVGIAGTVTTLAAVHLGLEPYVGSAVHGQVLTLEAVEAVVERLGAMTLAERSRVPGLDAKRADVIVAGGFVVLAVLEALGAKSTRVSDRGVRWGLARALFERAD